MTADIWAFMIAGLSPAQAHSSCACQNWMHGLLLGLRIPLRSVALLLCNPYWTRRQWARSCRCCSSLAASCRRQAGTCFSVLWLAPVKQNLTAPAVVSTVHPGQRGSNIVQVPSPSAETSTGLASRALFSMQCAGWPGHDRRGKNGKKMK